MVSWTKKVYVPAVSGAPELREGAVLMLSVSKFRKSGSGLKTSSSLKSVNPAKSVVETLRGALNAEPFVKPMKLSAPSKKGVVLKLCTKIALNCCPS